MKIFISGGVKNGKSYYAQRLAQAMGTPLYYVATMKSVDSEDDARIARHRDERDGWGFVTVEQPRDIELVLQSCDHSGSFLLDSVTALLANEMFIPPDWKVNDKAAGKIIVGLTEILSRVENIVIVSDFIYSDAILYDSYTESYRKTLAEIDRATACLCDVVLEAAYTNIIVHKGLELYEKMA